MHISHISRRENGKAENGKVRTGKAGTNVGKSRKEVRIRVLRTKIHGKIFYFFQKIEKKPLKGEVFPPINFYVALGFSID